MNQLTPAPQLYGRVLAAIAAEQQLETLRHKVAVIGFLFFAVLCACGFLSLDFFFKVRSSGFIELSRLAVTDYKIISFDLGDYSMSLLESLPAMSFGLLATAVLLLLMSGRKLLQYSLQMKKLRLET